MFRKLTISTLMVASMLTLLVGVSRAYELSDRRTDVVTWQFKGSSDTAVAVSSAGQIVAQDGIVSKHEVIPSITISTSGILNSLKIATDTFVGGSTTYIFGNFTQPQVPHALRVCIFPDAGVSSSTVNSTMTIKGVTAQGQSITWVQRVTTTPVVTGPAFATISSVTFSAISSVTVFADNIFINIGSTATFGLASSFERSDDVYKVRAFGIDSRQYSVNAGHDTVTQSTGPTVTGQIDVWSRDTRSAPPRPK